MHLNIPIKIGDLRPEYKLQDRFFAIFNEATIDNKNEFSLWNLDARNQSLTLLYAIINKCTYILSHYKCKGNYKVNVRLNL